MHAVKKEITKKQSEDEIILFSYLKVCFSHNNCYIRVATIADMFW